MDKKKKPFYKKWWVWLIAISIIAFGTTGENEENKAVDSAGAKETSVVNETENIEETKDETSPEKPSVPREFSSALKKAKSYAESMHMSKSAIYDQLVSEYGEQFPADAAQYAIDNLEFNWKANALEKAKSYANSMDMSTSAIYDQLVSEHGEKFTPEEAQYAVDNLE